jgi:hypothetical protein
MEIYELILVIGGKIKIICNNMPIGYHVCHESFIKYHGISSYQFYTILKHVDEGTAPVFMHGNAFWEHSSSKTDLYVTWLGQICSKLVEGLPIGFRLELAKRLFLKKCFEI